jgi:putative ABC transport system permease protein
MGFQPDNLIAAPMTVNADKQRDKATMLSYYEQALQRVRGLPGVSSVGITTQLPVQGQFNMGLLLLDTPEPDRGRGLQYRVQTADTFRTLGMRIVRGRDFQTSDRFGSLPVAIVNESFARRFGRDGDAIGNRVRMAGRDTPDIFTIVGIVNDVRETGLRSPVPPVVYMLFDQAPQETIRVVHQFVPAKWVIRVQPGVNPDLPGQIRREVGALDPSQPFQQFQTMQAIVSGTMQMERLLMALLGAFALLTLIMVASGLYGTLSYAVTQRRQEIGIRMAMGARWQDVVLTVSMSGASLVAAGVAVGLLASLWTAKLLAGFLFHVPAFDPWSMSGTAAVLILVSLIAGAGPSWNAVRTDPLRALRVD